MTRHAVFRRVGLPYGDWFQMRRRVGMLLLLLIAADRVSSFVPVCAGRLPPQTLRPRRAASWPWGTTWAWGQAAACTAAA